MKSLWIAVRASLVLLVLCGIIYPFVTTGFAQLLFPAQAEGSLIEANGKIQGSRMLAQDFTSPGFFHPRSSAANYDPKASAATNAAVASEDYEKSIQEKIAAIEKENPSLKGKVPADLVTTSGSGFDPDLSPEAAKAQIPRVAQATGFSEQALQQLVDQHTRGRALGIFGEPRVNVLELNLALLDMQK